MAPNDLTFLAPPGEVADWRLVLLCDQAASAGVLSALPGTVDGLAGDLGLEAHALRVVLQALEALGVVEAGEGGEYRPGPSAPDADTLHTIGHHARSMRRWVTAVGPALRGEDLRGEAATPDPEAFHDALAANARRVAPAVVDACLARFPDARTVLDLGGLHGEYSLEFTRRGLKATMQDRPAMIEVARKRGRLDAAGVELFAGSFFDSVPEGPFDLAFCSGITHTFDGERNLLLYNNLRPVVTGGVAVVTSIQARNDHARLFAVQMLINGNGGDTHTEAEYRQWLGEAGFTVDEGVSDLPGRGGRSVLFAT
jgi:SAM-dependent methyltransferase